MTKKQQAEQERAQAQENLRAKLPPGSAVYAKVEHVSKSGMMRVIRLYIKSENGIDEITHEAAIAADHTWNQKHWGIQMGGCGMDMCFAAVYELSHSLYPKGYECAGKDRCRSNDHNNGDRDYTPHWHSSGGYALVYRSL